jgi:hypothetical protein
MTDMKKPGKCITGYLVTRTFGVIVARKLFPSSLPMDTTD